MDRCFKCLERAAWLCECSKVYMCNKHYPDHLKLPNNHLMQPIKRLLSPEIINSLKEKLFNNLQFLDACSKKIINETNALISDIYYLCDSSLKKMQTEKEIYFKWLDEMNSFLTEEQIEECELLIKLNLFYDSSKTLKFIQQIPEFYRVEVIKKQMPINEAIEEVKIKPVEDEEWCNRLNGAIFAAHTEAVTSISLSSDSELMVTGSYDKTVRLWKLKDKTQVFVFIGHKDSVLSVGLSNKKKFILSASEDKTIRLWDIPTKTEVFVFKGHTGIVRDITITNDDNYFVSGSDDGTIKIWNLQTRTQIKVLKILANKVLCVSISSDSKTLVAGTYNSPVILFQFSKKSPSDSLFAYSIQNPLNGHTDSVWSIRISYNCQFAVSCSSDKTVRIWNIKALTQEHIFYGHTNLVNSIAITSDDNYIVSVSKDKTMKIWSVLEKKQIENIEGFPTSILSVEISTNNKLIMIGYREVCVRTYNF